jgi:signal transduction histidine kinase
VLLALAAGAWWIVRLGLRPLDQIGVTAGAIAAGDLSRRVEKAEPRTEVGRLGLALNAMLARLEEAFAERRASEERLRRFLADASHELRTPLASIRGYAELFRIGAAREGPEMEKAMRRIEAESARMGVLVEDLLALARLDEVRDVHREPVDVAALAADAVADARAVAPDDLRLLVGPPDDGHRDRERRRGDDVATGDRRPGARGEGLHRADELEHRRGVEAVGQPERDVRLAGVGAHRGEVGERCRQRAVAGVGRGDARVVEAEVDPVDHRVDARDLERPRADDRGVVAEPPDEAVRARFEQPLERGDERELTAGAWLVRQRWR